MNGKWINQDMDLTSLLTAVSSRGKLESIMEKQIKKKATNIPSSSESVKALFSEVPATYELVNHLLTFCLDTAWRKRAAVLASKGRNGRWCDMCTGTGETVMYLQRLAPEDTEVYGVDFSESMMEQARKKKDNSNVTFVTADIRHLPFPDAHFDVITMSFASRNINQGRDALVEAFSEYYRVLKPGGRFVNLETSQPANDLVRCLFHLYVKAFVKVVGYGVSGSKKGYAYLAATIPRFYCAPELGVIIGEAGFDRVTYKKLFLGVTAIHICEKLQ